MSAVYLKNFEKDTVLQIEKGLINDRLYISDLPLKFSHSGSSTIYLCKIFRRTNISTPLAYQVRNFAYVLNG